MTESTVIVIPLAANLIWVAPVHLNPRIYVLVTVRLLSSFELSECRHLVGGALTDAGSLYQWFGRTLQGGGTQTLWDEVL